MRFKRRNGHGTLRRTLAVGLKVTLIIQLAPFHRSYPLQVHVVAIQISRARKGPVVLRNVAAHCAGGCLISRKGWDHGGDTNRPARLVGRSHDSI